MTESNSNWQQHMRRVNEVLKAQEKRNPGICDGCGEHDAQLVDGYCSKIGCREKRG